MLENIKSDTNKLKNPEKAKLLAGFFKTGKGEYGEGDKFLGLMVPQQRSVAKKYRDLKLSDVQSLLKSKFHEYRLIGLLILVHQYEKTDDDKVRTKIVSFYLKNTDYINNWDLVDLTAPKILGHWSLNHDRKILYKLAKSESLWERRISILATFTFIKNNQFDDVLKLSALLLTDSHDLIHKAVGWMLREIGKRNQSIEENFLKKHYKTMPRTMLRYAIEKFPEKKRQFYLKK